MIEHINGKIEHVSAEYAVLEANGIGYQIFCPNPFIYRPGKAETIYTYHYVREDLIALYGFKTRKERDLFLKLLNVSGIGPKGALAIMAFGQPEQVIRAIEAEDEGFLVKFPGVGKKTARQMILDLKGKLSIFTEEPMEGLFAGQASDSSEQLDEAVEALTALGYAKKEINKVLPSLKKEDLTTDQYIRKALQKLVNH
ncbi:Holliday junction branch migration protein RuvA [Fictibacillus sp. KIGAM418]|uniref:Holliday junction branch migration complex subunit RuvA n=1 Tax=Fictibacillus marinisediminis TaxID=2878389 RepID=A0A9X2BG29_9BACL|nr:Holliday junction branch migration protein RuvA [Fictibacillus marinisediminis]MCK6257892.1 Holliday junction branch migration protein RuvA [Fictibacillus marinisediminis]